MEFLLNAGFEIGVLMFLLLLTKKDKKKEDYLFWAWITISLCNIAFYIVTIYQFELRGLWAILGFGLPLLSAPLLFLYICSLTCYQLQLRKASIHLSIYPLYVIGLLFLQWQDATQIVASNGFFDFPDPSSLWTQYYPIPIAISSLVYCIWDLALLAKHRIHIKEVFSYVERIKLSWLNYVVYSYLMIYLIGTILIFGTIHFNLMPLEKAFTLMGIALCAMLCGFGFYGFRQTPIFSNIEIHDIPQSSDIKTEISPSYTKSGLTQEKVNVMAAVLSQHMAERHPYLNEDLNLNLLAEQCQIKPAQLSQIINQKFDMNFYDFINQYRIEEVKCRLHSTDNDHLTILGIAMDCGFKSKSSFNRYFKKYTGMSPTAFKTNRHP